jgi:hypothetical protein
MFTPLSRLLIFDSFDSPGVTPYINIVLGAILLHTNALVFGNVLNFKVGHTRLMKSLGNGGNLLSVATLLSVSVLIDRMNKMAATVHEHVSGVDRLSDA